MMPRRSPSAFDSAWPIAMPVSSTVWWSSMCRSPLALTVMSISECRESWSSIWSKKPTPVAMSELPAPSTSRETEISVSLVLRLTSAERDTMSICAESCGSKA